MIKGAQASAGRLVELWLPLLFYEPFNTVLMNNRVTLYREGLPLRLRQVGLQVLIDSEKENVRICVDPEKTTSEKVAFFVRTPQGKPNRRDARIKPIVQRAAEKYGDKVVVENGVISLPSEKKDEKPEKTTTRKPKSSKEPETPQD